MTFYIFLGLIAAVVLYCIVAYNRLVRSKNLTAEGWSGIDVQLRRRADLIPNLVTIVQAYATHEMGTFAQVTQARAATLGARNIGSHAAAANSMQLALANLFAVAEAYPELKADTNFRQLATELSTIEDDIQFARRYYNGATRNLNVLIESFPSNLVAGFFRFKKAEYFNIGDEASRNVPRLSFEAA